MAETLLALSLHSEATCILPSVSTGSYPLNAVVVKHHKPIYWWRGQEGGVCRLLTSVAGPGLGLRWVVASAFRLCCLTG